MAETRDPPHDLRSVTLHSVFFREGFLPEHVLLTSDELTWALEQLLRHILNTGAAEETELPNA